MDVHNTDKCVRNDAQELGMQPLCRHHRVAGHSGHASVPFDSVAAANAPALSTQEHPSSTEAPSTGTSVSWVSTDVLCWYYSTNVIYVGI